MENQVIYLIEVYRYTVNEDASHYVLNAWSNKEEAITATRAHMEIYKDDGYNIHKTEDKESNHIGYIDNGETSRHYWINEVKIIK